MDAPDHSTNDCQNFHFCQNFGFCHLSTSHWNKTKKKNSFPFQNKSSPIVPPSYKIFIFLNFFQNFQGEWMPLTILHMIAKIFFFPKIWILPLVNISLDKTIFFFSIFEFSQEIMSFSL